MRRTLVTLLLAASGVGSLYGAGVAQARPSSWKPFCAQLDVIKKRSETPGGWTSFGPDDPYGLKHFAADYDRLERIVPSTQASRLLASARPLLAHPVALFTSKTKKAIRPAQKLRPIVAVKCELDVSDVFKVGFP